MNRTIKVTIFMQMAFSWLFFSFRSILKGGETENKEAPDEAFIGKVSQRSPSVVQSCGAMSKHPVLLEPRGG